MTNKELAHIFAAAESLTNGKMGVRCVRSIVIHLNRDEFAEAEQIAYHDHDKIAQYPILHELSCKFFPKVKDLYK